MQVMRRDLSCPSSLLYVDGEGCKLQVAPVKCSIFPLSSSQALVAQAEQISKSLKKLGFSTKIDTTSVTIGRRYDEWMNRE